MKAVNIGLIGLGTVGSGMLTVLNRNAEEIARRAGRDIRVKAVAVRNLDKSRITEAQDLYLTDDMMEVATHPDIEVVVELVGAQSGVLDTVMAALDHGKHVVTANKAMIALHGNRIFSRALEQGLVVAFEAAVAGGIPIIKSLREGLAANRICWLAGIINGTCNYILSQMDEQGRSFESVLLEAQTLGYAESDPTFDIEGVDAAHKLTILASIAFGIPLRFGAVHVEGVTGIGAEDMVYARDLGYRIKHIGFARLNGGAVELRVHPTLIPSQNPIASVNGVMNAVLVQSDAVGSTLYCGAGAGAEPTASAVVADLIDVVRTITTDPQHRVPHLAFQADLLLDIPVLDISEVESSYYLRMSVTDKLGVMASIATIFSDAGISIDSILQKGHQQPDERVTIIMLTHNTVEANVTRAVEQVERLEAIHEKVVRIRLEQFS